MPSPPIQAPIEPPDPLPAPTEAIGEADTPTPRRAFGSFDPSTLPPDLQARFRQRIPFWWPSPTKDRLSTLDCLRLIYRYRQRSYTYEEIATVLHAPRGGLSQFLHREFRRHLRYLLRTYPKLHNRKVRFYNFYRKPRIEGTFTSSLDLWLCDLCEGAP